MYMDDIKLFDKNKKELEVLIKSVGIYSQDIGIEFAIEKCTMLILKIEKRHKMKGIELPNQGKIRTHRKKENFKYFEISKVEMKETI